MLNKQSDLDSRYPPSLNSLKGRREKVKKVMSPGFSKAKKNKNFPMQEISIKFVYSRQQKMKDFSFQGRKGQIFAGGSDRFRFFMHLRL